MTSCDVYCLFDGRTGEELFYQGDNGIPEEKDHELIETCVFKISHKDRGVCVCAVCNGRIGEGGGEAVECKACEGAVEEYVRRGVFMGTMLWPYLIPSERNVRESDNDDPEAPDYSGEYVLDEESTTKPHAYYVELKTRNEKQQQQQQNRILTAATTTTTNSRVS